MGSFGKKGGSSTTTADKKKQHKGPKGKKARAKAKLDKQWGEIVTQPTTPRKGKSRLQKSMTAKSTTATREKQQQQHQQQQLFNDAHSQTPKTSVEMSMYQQSQRTQRQSHDDVSQSSDSCDSSHEERNKKVDNEEDHNPLQSLLTMLQTKSQHKTIVSKNPLGDTSKQFPNMIVTSHDNDNPIMNGINEDSSDSDDDSNLVDMEDSEEEDLHNDEEQDEIMEDTMELFRQRFQRPPLTQLELSSTNMYTQKIPMQDNLAELQFASTLPVEAHTDNVVSALLSSLKTNDAFQTTAMNTLFTTSNTPLLRRQWQRIIHKRKTSQELSEKCQAPLPLLDHNDNVQATVYCFLTRYCDLFVTTGNNNNNNTNDDQKRGRKSQRKWHQLYLLHILNHVLTSQRIITRNNNHINNKLLQEAKTEDRTNGINDMLDDDDDDDPDQFRDQGFTRPTVLVLLPTRGTCYRFIKNLYRMLGSSYDDMDQETKERWEGDYGPILPDEEDLEKLSNNEKEQRRKRVLEQKGKEWNSLFGENTNQDDNFKIGISLLIKDSKTKGKAAKQSTVSVRLYTDFFKSDIIVASPLGLKILITPEDTDSDAAFSDYLSSIEICLLQHSDVMMMQNWDHVNDILKALNQQPKSNNYTDFSRVRNYHLEGQGAHWRQLIVSTKFMDPSLISSFKRFGKSISGSVKIRRKTASEDASISSIVLPIKQVFQKVPVASFAKQSQARVDYFLKNLLPQIQKQNQKHTMVFIPSYFDFCSVRNALLKKEDVSFVSVTEYSRISEVSRGRARYLHGQKLILLYTGRAHYFHRHAIKGTHHLIFLGLPEHPEFYTDHVNLVGNMGRKSGTNNSNGNINDDNDYDDDENVWMDITSTSCIVLFTKYEAHALDRIVGSSHANRMLSSPKSTFMFHL